MKTNERKAARPMYLSACAGCAEKLRALYELEEQEEERVGKCPWCFQFLHLTTFRYRRKAPRARSARPPGGGERARASG